MKKKVMALTAAVMLTAPFAWGDDVGIGVNIQIGNRPAPVPVGPAVVIEEPPVFLVPPALGFSVAVGVPYDLFYISGMYYFYSGGVWYRGPYYNGPWVLVKHKHLPPGLRKHKFERIRHFRDEEFRAYRADESRYRGKHFRPEKVMKEMHKEERKRLKEEKKWEKEERKRQKHGKHGED